MWSGTQQRNKYEKTTKKNVCEEEEVDTQKIKQNENSFFCEGIYICIEKKIICLQNTPFAASY